MRVISCCDHSRSIRKNWSLIRLLAYEESYCKQQKYNNGEWSQELLAKGVKDFMVQKPENVRECIKKY